MTNRDADFKKMVIEYYLKNGSIRKTAQNFKIHYQTLYKWLKIYKKAKDRFFLSCYKSPWNRTRNVLEREIISLKEKNPTITIRNAQDILRKKGIKISYHTIWSIWKRYGYVGSVKKRIETDDGKPYAWSSEAQKKFALASKLFGDGNIREAARILNSIPFLPKNELLTQIPDKFLNLPRRLEKSIALFGKIPVAENIKILDNLYNEAKRKGLLYLAARTGLAEIALLSWKGDLLTQQGILNEIKVIFNNKGKRCADTDFNLYFTILIAEGNLYIDLFKINQAYRIARFCHLSLMRRRNSDPDLILHLARLYVRLGEIKRAEYWYQQALSRMSDELKRELNAQLALNIHFMKGEYKQALELCKDPNLPEWIRTALPLRFKSLYYLIKGNPNLAIETAIKSLNLSKEQELPRDIFNASLTIAAAFNAIGEKDETIKILKNLKKYIEKFKLTVQEKMLQIILEGDWKCGEEYKLPILRMGVLLRNNRYQQALNLAKKKGLITIFYRYILFISQSVLSLLAKGKDTGLPKSILKLPIFNRETITFYVKFIGNLTITRNQKFIKAKLKPKDAALLIHLSLKLNAPDSFIYLDDLCRNFWGNQATAHRNLSHALNRLKKQLNIPGHYLEIGYNSGVTCLKNNNLFFTTDYQDILRTISQARALERTGEWEFAKKEYLKAFSLFRGEPFKKNFDQWSVDLRYKILSNFEIEGINFARNCLAQGDKLEARRVLKKVLKIIPDSTEAKNICNFVIP
ncbi:MAG: helix-turn-helix domain-containing protein [candidate division WOR-3 bacterium]